MKLTIDLTSDESKDFVAYCNLNNLVPEQIFKKCFLEGYRIEKYGLLNSRERVIEKEVIVEVPKIEYVEVEKPVEVIKEIVVEKMVEVEVIKEVIVEKPVEVQVIKEVVVEKPVEVIREVIVEKMVEGTVEVPGAPVEVIKYVDREVIKEVLVEVIKEVPVEVIKEVEKEQPDIKAKLDSLQQTLLKLRNIKAKLDSLQQTLLKLRNEMLDKDKKIEECQSLIKEFEAVKTQQAAFLRGSNLNNKLY